jgi:hypothetical protein
MVEIDPVRIGLFNRPNFPSAVPSFQPFLSAYGILDAIELFEVDESIHVVLFGETVYGLFAMLMDAPNEIAGHAYVERPADLACKDVNPEAPFFGHKDWIVRLRGR